MRKKHSQQKKIKITRLDHFEVEKTKLALINAVVSTFGYNPEFDYAISAETKHENLKPVCINLLKIQTRALYISNHLKHKFQSCKKYIYKVEDQLISNPTKNDERELRRFIFHMIGKIDAGYIPFKLVITFRHNPYETNFENIDESSINSPNSCFYALIKGQEYFVIDRFDNSNLVHHNKYFNANENVFEREPENRKIVGCHKHEYNEEVLLHSFNRCLKANKNTDEILNIRVVRENDAKTQERQNFTEMLDAYLTNINATCLPNIEENLPLSQIYNHCQIEEQNLYKDLGIRDQILKNIININLSKSNARRIKSKKEDCLDLDKLHVTKEY